jgi:hypothetical protein
VRAAIVVGVVLSALGCGDDDRRRGVDSGAVDAGGDAMDAGSEGGVDAGSALRPAPDGTGFCCPRARHPSCECSDVGGFVTDDDPSLCTETACGVAGIDWHPAVDEHGCDVWTVTTTMPDGCSDAGPMPDAGGALDGGGAPDASGATDAGVTFDGGDGGASDGSDATDAGAAPDL